MDKFIHIRSPKFAILPGEEEELVNDGMYGKALAQYLQAKLGERGYNAPFVCCEDWGWWVELKTAPFRFGVCIYCGPETGGPLDLFCAAGITGDRKWTWRGFQYIDTVPWVEKLYGDLVSIFRADADVEILNTSLDSPFTEEPDDDPGPQPKQPPRRFTLFGSRFLFCMLAPWVVAGVPIFTYVAYQEILEGKPVGVILASMLALCCLCAVLMAASPKRLGWLGLFISGSVAAAYIWYFCDTYFVQRLPLTPSGRDSEPTPWNAIVGFLVWGLPSLLFTIRGIKTLIHERRRKNAQQLDRPDHALP